MLRIGIRIIGNKAKGSEGEGMCCRSWNELAAVLSCAQLLSVSLRGLNLTSRAENTNLCLSNPREGLHLPLNTSQFSFKTVCFSCWINVDEQSYKICSRHISDHCQRSYTSYLILTGIWTKLQTVSALGGFAGLLSRYAILLVLSRS